MTTLDLFAKEYLGKIFYFCLKKTGDEQEAADLSGEISLEVVQALSGGKEPEHFAAWVWAVARNRWAKWSAKRYYHAFEPVDPQAYEEVLPSEESVEEGVIRAEEAARVRRGLAFIRSDYRSILVAHYFEGKSVSMISRQFGIPIGTVKTRLQSSRRILKEGMDMARQFGTRSFQPETVRFESSGYQPTGLPHRAVNRKIPVNILCEADNNPGTVEELSMELGIAVPYMEEEVELLVRGDLLRRLDSGKVLTNFFISPRECQNEVHELACRFAEKNYEEIWKAAGSVLERGREQRFIRGEVSGEDGQAYLAFWLTQRLEGEELPPNIYGCFRRSDGGNWGVIGKEAGAVCRLSVRYFNNRLSQWNIRDENGQAAAVIRWNGYQAEEGSDYGRRPYKYDVPENHLLKWMKKAAEEEQWEGSAVEEEVLAELLDQGFCVRTQEGVVRTAALAIRERDEEKIEECLAALPEYGRLREEMREYVDGMRRVVGRYCAQYFQKDIDYYVMMSSNLRAVLAPLWKDKGLYLGGNAQFGALYY